MKNLAFFLFVLPLTLWVSLIFFDKAKSDVAYEETVILYSNDLYGESVKETRVLELEAELANAYQQDKNQRISQEINRQEEDRKRQEFVELAHQASLEKTRKLEEEQRKKILEEQMTPLPTSVDLPNVIFYSQAPNGNWNEPYQNACEEASILLAYYYTQWKRPDKKSYNQDLLNLMAWEQHNLWYHKDTTIEEFLYLIKNFLKHQNAYIVNNPSIQKIKREISKWNIIIAPFRGKELYNPHYSLGGPDYHVMVIKGYTASQFIVHDVWTVRGESWKYNIDVIMSALSNGNKKELHLPWSKIIVMWK